MKNKKRWLIISAIILGALVVLVLAGVILEQWLRDYSPIPQSAASTIPEPSKTLSPLENREHDWPAWKGPQADNIATFTEIKTDWSGGLTKLWEVNYLCQGKDSVSWSCPAIKGNRLVIPGRDEKNEYIFCLDPDSGDLIWYQRFQSEPVNKSYGIGARATPAIDEDRVFTLSRGGKLIAWYLKDGKKIWERSLTNLGGEVPQWGYAGSPVVYGDTVVVQSGGESVLIAFEKTTGEVKWRTPAGVGSYSTPVLVPAESRTYWMVLAGQYLFGFNDGTGQRVWELPFVTSNNINIVTPPVVNEKNITVISAWYGMGSKGVRISPGRAEVLWENQDLQAHQADPFILGEYVYSFSGMSGQNLGSFKCVELATGEEKWSTNAIGNGQFIYVEPYFISLDLKGNLFLVEPDPNAFKLVTSFPGAIPDVKQRSWTKPILAQGKLYLRFAHQLICYDIRK